MAPSVSVIVPVAPGDEAWRTLIPTLTPEIPCEILLASGQQELDLSASDIAQNVSFRCVTGGKGRAGQMNAAAKEATAEWFWFLHADSRFLPETLPALTRTILEGRDALHFFDLKFADGPSALSWNEWAVRWRAGTLRLPFGDQGFLIKRDLFHALGAYREDLAYGEDHVFAWKVMQEGYEVLPVGAPLLTSGRKYQSGGWFKVTLVHVWLTIKQAVPQYFVLWKRRMVRAFS